MQTPTQDDLNTAQRALGMAVKSRVQLQNSIDWYAGEPYFASRVIREAAQQMLTTKARMGMFAGEEKGK